MFAWVVMYIVFSMDSFIIMIDFWLADFISSKVILRLANESTFVWKEDNSLLIL